MADALASIAAQGQDSAKATAQVSKVLQSFREGNLYKGRSQEFFVLYSLAVDSVEFNFHMLRVERFLLDN